VDSPAELVSAKLGSLKVCVSVAGRWVYIEEDNRTELALPALRGLIIAQSCIEGMTALAGF